MLLKVSKEKSINKYPALTIIAGIYKVFAIIGGLVALLSIVTLLNASAGTSQITASITLGASILTSLTLLAFSEGIKVFLDIEANTRKASERISD